MSDEDDSEPEYTWRDQMVGERMAVDQEFSPRVADSEFSNQEWGLIMTATNFEIENPEDPETARLVADTSKVKHVVPELEKMQESMNQMGGAPGGGGRSGGSGGSGGFLGSVKDALGLGEGGGGRDVEDTVSRADALTREYAGKLQERLEANGKWEGIRAQAAAEAGHHEDLDDPGSGSDPSTADADESDADEAEAGEADADDEE